MKTYFVVNIEDFELKAEHPYTIYFTATCPTFHHEVFNMEYTGPDLNYTVSLPSDYMEKICKEMQGVFGYGPFERDKVEVAMNQKRQFRIKQ